MLDAVKVFKAFGWSFFPLIHGTKRPAVKWEEYMTRRPTDEEINEWLSKGYTDFAVVCGPVSSDLVILDFESEADFHEFFPQWEKLAKSTIVVSSVHGGVHVYLHGAGIKRTIRVFGENHPVDLLGEGGYAVAFGSEVNHNLCDKTKCSKSGWDSYRLFPQSEGLVREAVEGNPPVLTDITVEALGKRARALGWRFALEPQEEQVETKRRLTDEAIEKAARVLAPYWTPGSRNYFTITICGAFIHNGIYEETTKAVIRRICEIKGDDTLEERLKTVEYEYSPRRLNKRLTGLPTLLDYMKQKSPRGEADFREVAELIRPPENEPRGNRAVRIGDWILTYFDVITVRDNEEIFVRNEVGIYVPDETRLKEAIWNEFRDENLRRNDVEDILEYIRARTYADRSIFEMPRELIPLRNGVLNVETMEFRGYSEDDHFTFYLPINYDPNARLENGSCPNFQKLLNESLYPEDVPALQEWFGYALWRDYPNAKALVLLGEGSNGKSVVIDTLIAMLGRHNVSSYSLQELETNRFALARLHRKLANVRSELPHEALRNTGIFKQLTGGDQITAEVKFGKRDITFTSYAKMIFATNRLPKTSDESFAFFRRWTIITFPYTFLINPKLGEKQADPSLKEKIITNELPCVFNWAVEGLRRLKANSWVFTNTKSADEVREEYLRSADPVRAFINDALEITNVQEVYTLKEDIYGAYVKYCKKYRVPALGYDSFFRRLKQEGVKAEEIRVQTDMGKKRALTGIVVKQEECWGNEECGQESII